MHLRRAFLIPCLSVLIWGCDEAPITAPETDPETEPQEIVGRVVANETGVEVSAWQAQLVRRTVADSAGYFVLESMPVGLYEIIIVSPSGDSLSLRGITVAANETTTLKEIRLSSPRWPLLDVYPGDSSFGVQPLNPVIRITSVEPLDVGTMAAAISFTPSLPGTWVLSRYISSPGYGYYEFRPSVPMEVATQYVMRIDAQLALAGGQTWDDTLENVFWTDSLHVVYLGPSSYGSSEGLVNPGLNIELYIGFNAMVHPDSLTRAASFTPDLEGVWLQGQISNTQSTLQFFHTGSSGLRADSTYVLHIDPGVPLVGSSGLVGVLDLPFRTAPVRVVYTSPRQGSSTLCTGCPVQFQFNCEMDSTSVVAAFAMQTIGGDPVAGHIERPSSYEFRFWPDSAYTIGEVYQARITTLAESVLGDHLKEPFTLYFRVGP